MADRIVYLVSQRTKHMDGADLTFVDDAELSVLLADGWETSTTLPDRKVKANGKSVTATMMVLKRASENRGVSRRDPGDDGDGPMPRGRGEMIPVTDEFGFTRQVSLTQAFVDSQRSLGVAIREASNQPGHLGAPKNHNMPGLTIISGEMIGKAFDMGIAAGMRGEDKSSNPFPPNSAPASKWLQGFKAASQSETVVDKVALNEAEEAGYSTAMSLGLEDEALCPYLNAQLRERWKTGFVRGGGVLE